MPEVQHTTTLARPVPEVWDFVKDMDNWAPFLTGYQSHEVESQTDSVWTLKGDVGILSRVVNLRVHITEWDDPRRVRFTLTGLNEEVGGSGSFLLEEYVSDGPAPDPPPASWWQRLLDRIRALFGAGGTQRISAHPPAAKLTFNVGLEAGGPMGPVVNALLGPWLGTFAADLATRITTHLEPSPEPLEAERG